jgi:hypothetical protein
MDGSGSYSKEYGSDIKKMGGKRKSRSMTRRREHGGQQFRSRAGGKKWGGKGHTKRRGRNSHRCKK